MGPEAVHDNYHIEVVRSPLTRNLAARFPDVQDEIRAAFEEFVPQTQEWSAIKALSTIRKIVSRSSNRLFVGLPLCRNEDYRDLNIEFAVDVMKTAQSINLFPNFLKPFVGRYLSNVESYIDRAMGHLRPTIQERLRNEAKYGKDWPGKPMHDKNDALSWLLEQSNEHQKTVRDLTIRILVINFAAIHTTSQVKGIWLPFSETIVKHECQAFTQALFDLAANPSFAPVLREEVETVIKEEGYSKMSLHKMVKLDSFIKESQRLGANNALIMQRKVLKDFVFSDGTVVPKGNIIAVPNFAMHHDEENYVDAPAFDGFRFSKMRELEPEGFSKHQMVALSYDYIVFGHGRHA
ncbi:hypothetical protein C0992_001937, partial [Termitomyces sp. T32_za158]